MMPKKPGTSHPGFLLIKKEERNIGTYPNKIRFYVLPPTEPLFITQSC